MVVTGSAHRESVERQLPEIGVDNLVIETEPKDSSAAIGLAAALLELRDPEAVSYTHLDVYKRQDSLSAHTSAA